MSTTQVIPENRTVRIETAIHVIECAACSIDFGIGVDFERRRRDDHGTFYCPNGHENYYPQDNEAEKLRKELARVQQQRDYARRDRDEQRERRLTAERQRAAAKGQVTKIKNRVSKGVCPCCNRSFANLADHMAGQHPDWTGDSGGSS